MKNEIRNSKTAVDEITAVQVAPAGDFEGVLHKTDGKTEKVTQKLGVEAFERIINAWKGAGAPELLVDADHESCEGGSTRAYAWASNLRTGENGLVADFRWTNIGAEAVNAREYRFVSPVFGVDDHGEIATLTSIALTNKPNLPVSCVLNRESAGEGNVEDKEKEKSMEKILSELGLEADAGEEAAVAAIRAIKKEAEEAKAAAKAAEAEKFADENAERIENREAVIEFYIKNGREACETIMGALKAPSKAVSTPVEKPAQTVLNAKNGKTPDMKGSWQKGLAECRNAEERVAYVMAHA